jgi:photosystem II stability/assembly factor-like uncharacterized protein
MRFKLFIGLALVTAAGLSDIRAENKVIPPAAGIDARIQRFHMLDARYGWAWVCTNNELHPRFVLTRDGGETWVNRTPPEGPDTDFGQAYFLDSKRGWVFASDRKSGNDSLMITANGGESWKQAVVPFFVTEGLNAKFYSAERGVARQADGGLGSVVYNYCETRDGGKTWKPLIITPPGGGDPNEPPGSIHLCSLCSDGASFSPPATVIITYGDTGDEKPKGAARIAHSADLGKSWQNLDLLLPDQCRDGLCEPMEPVFFGEKKAVLPVRVYKQNADETYAYRMMVFYTTDDGGAKWAQAPGVVEFKEQSLEANECEVASPKDFFVHSDGKLLVTHDGARTWQTIQPNIAFGGPHAEIAQMDFVDAKHGWVDVCDIGEVDHDQLCHFYWTSDGGKTWGELKVRIALKP